MISSNWMTGKHFFPVFLFFFFVLNACSDNNVPTTPNYPPNTFCDVSGTYSLYYKGQGKVFGLTDKYGANVGVMANTFFKDSTGKVYFMGINVYYKDGAYKTGTFPFVGKEDPNLENFAVAFFESGDGALKKTFISYSGEIIMEEISLTVFKAKFNFMAKDANNNNVTIKNGIVEIID